MTGQLTITMTDTKDGMDVKIEGSMENQRFSDSLALVADFAEALGLKPDHMLLIPLLRKNEFLKGSGQTVEIWLPRRDKHTGDDTTP